MSRPLLVTAALPYANGPLHFGHVAGAYLPADIFVRYQRLKGEDALFVCGTDEHGVAITMKAEKEKQSYQEYVDHWHARIRSFFDQLHISFDIFSQTSHRDPHYQLSQEFFLRLFANGKVIPRRIQQQYCERDQRFLPDRFVEGTCYLCKSPGARGDECKSCGQWLDATRLIDPTCAQCKTTPVLRDSMQYELDLTDFQQTPELEDWYRRFTGSQKQNVRTFVVNKMVEGEGMKPRPITRDLPWGVPVPERTLLGEAIEEARGKVLYVWFDAPIGYISATIELFRERGDPEGWRRYWIHRRGEEGPRLIHFIGKDNIPFHCIVFPCMLGWQGLGDEQLQAAPPGSLLGPGNGEVFALPEAVPANEFYNLENRKFSTSDGWYIDLDTFFESYDSSQIRFYLASSLPETGDANFLWLEFQAKVNELADTFGNLASRVVAFVHKYRDGKVPSADGDGRLVRAVREAVERARGEWAQAIESFQFRRAVQAFLELCRFGNKLLDDEKPWSTRKTDPAACDETLYAELFLLRALVPLSQPFIPDASRGLREMLAVDEIRPGGLDAWLEPLPPGQALGAARPLIQKIDDEAIQREVERLRR